MTRQEFLSTTFAAGLGLAVVPGILSCAAPRNLFAPFVPSAGDLKTVRGNVSRYTNKGGTVGIFETKDGFVVVDSQFPDSIQPVLDSISSKRKPVLYLLNTHHHGDHTAGNFAFQDQKTKIVAHSRVPELQRVAAEKGNKLNEQRYATELFDSNFSIDLGREKVRAYHFGNGHTFGDAMYHFENDNVVHMGDLIFINMIPVYRTADGSDSRNWISVLEKALSTFGDDTRFIFGHADVPGRSVGSKENIREMISFLAASNEFMLKAIKDGKSNDDLLKEHTFIPDFENRTTPQRFKAYLDELRITLG